MPKPTPAEAHSFPLRVAAQGHAEGAVREVGKAGADEVELVGVEAGHAAGRAGDGPGVVLLRVEVVGVAREIGQRGEGAQVEGEFVAVIPFTHPLDGHDFSKEQQERLGWNDPAGGYRRWNDFVNDVYAELTDRYGKDLMAIGFDSEFSISNTKNGKANWTGIACARRFSHGSNETCELGMKELWRPSWFEPWMTRPEDDYNVETWPAYRRCIGIVQGHHWATITPPSGGQARLTAEQMYRYTVLQAGTATEGPGVSWAASPYTDGLWEKDVREAFAKLASYMAPVSESLRDVYASRSYPINEGSTLTGLPHGVVGTRKTDDTVEYLHVLNPPTGRTLALPTPADGERFTTAALLADGAAVELKQDA